MNQQRRFFLAAVGLSIIAIIKRAVKPRASLSLATAIFAALLFSSCASLTPERIDALIQIAGQAAQIGVQIWLQQHPAHRPAFQVTVDSLVDEQRKGNTNMADFAELLNGLPTPTLASTNGAVYITGDRIVIRDEATDKSYAATMAMVRATVAGMKRGMAPMPPRLPSGRASRASLPGPERAARDLREHGVVLQTNELSDAELDAQFEAIKARLASRTNIVSTVDVQPTPNGASVVTVRWTGKPGVYCVQQRDEGSVEWLHFGYATNAASWETGWHPSLPVGHWRVVRVK